MIGIICALQYEAELVKNALSEVTEKEFSRITYVQGKYAGKEVVCAVCGIGKVFAALCAQTMILVYHPAIIINTGVGGALSDDLHMLDCVVSEKCVQHDMDTTAFGDPPGMISGINIVEFASDKSAVALMLECLRDIGVTARGGVITTGDVFVSSNSKKNDIRQKFNASVCEMESGAIAQVCYVNNVSFLAVRAISDNSDDDSSRDYTDMCRTAAKNSAAATLEYIKRTDRL